MSSDDWLRHSKSWYSGWSLWVSTFSFPIPFPESYASCAMHLSSKQTGRRQGGLYMEEGLVFCFLFSDGKTESFVKSLNQSWNFVTSDLYFLMPHHFSKPTLLYLRLPFETIHIVTFLFKFSVNNYLILSSVCQYTREFQRKWKVLSLSVVDTPCGGHTSSESCPCINSSPWLQTELVTCF